MKAILMVCLGNICRSPLAEGILRHQLKEAGLQHIRVDSAGTSKYHIGQQPDSRSIKSGQKHGIDISELKGRQFTVADFDNFDLIFVMDSSNYQDVIAMSRNDSDKEKVELLLNMKSPGKNLAVPDPYYGGESGFETVFQLLNEACVEVVRSVISK